MTLPLRAVGGNVLLKKVAADVHRGALVVFGGRSTNVYQVGEVLGLGGYWTRDQKWQPPMPNVRRTPLNNGGWDADWTPPDLSMRPPPDPPRFYEGHRSWLGTVRVGDLVVFINSRVYDYFEWDGEDILVYPGNWIVGVVEGTTLNENPELRRYEREAWDDGLMPGSVNKHSEAAAKRAAPITNWRDVK